MKLLGLFANAVITIKIQKRGACLSLIAHARANHVGDNGLAVGFVGAHVGNLAALMQGDNAVGDRKQMVEVIAAKKDGHPLFTPFLNKLEQPLLVGIGK